MWYEAKSLIEIHYSYTSVHWDWFVWRLLALKLCTIDKAMPVVYIRNFLKHQVIYWILFTDRQNWPKCCLHWRQNCVQSLQASVCTSQSRCLSWNKHDSVLIKLLLGPMVYTLAQYYVCNGSRKILQFLFETGNLYTISIEKIGIHYF